MWRAVQALVWLLGAAEIVALFVAPQVGIAALWNVLIPIAPALLVFAPGLWRNICPLGTTALLPERLRASSGRRLSPAWQARLNLAGIAALLLIVPLRHVSLNRNGPATAVTLVALAGVAVAAGARFERKSGWCSGLCPVHPVERLYGSNPLATLPSAHCPACLSCSTPCPDWTPGIHPLTGSATLSRTFSGTLLAGGFAGYVWGWFQVPDHIGAVRWDLLAAAYGWPMAGLAVTLTAFLLLKSTLFRRHEAALVRLFAAAAVSCYYAYRIPMLFGFGASPGDGLLIDLRGTLPASFPVASAVATTALFVGWFMIRPFGVRPWCVRPAPAGRAAL